MRFHFKFFNLYRYSEAAAREVLEFFGADVRVRMPQPLGRAGHHFSLTLFCFTTLVDGSRHHSS